MKIRKFSCWKSPKRKYMHEWRLNRKWISLAYGILTTHAVFIITCDGAKVQVGSYTNTTWFSEARDCNFTSLIITTVLEALKSLNKAWGIWGEDGALEARLSSEARPLLAWFRERGLRRWFCDENQWRKKPPGKLKRNSFYFSNT